MNSLLFNILVICSLVLFMVFSILAYRKKDRPGKYVGRGIISSSFVIISYGAALYVNNDTAVSVCLSLEHIFILWTVYFLSRYVEVYTGKKLHHFWKVCFVSVYIVDTILHLTNPVNHFVANYYVTKRDGYFRMIMEPQFFYYIHLLLCFFTLSYTLMNLLVKTMKTSVYYRLKYLLEAVVISEILCLEIWFLSDNRLGTDYSVFGYGVAAVLFYYCTYVFAPKNLINKVSNMVADSVVDATAIYDAEGKLIRENSAMREIISASECTEIEDMYGFLNIEKPDDRNALFRKTLGDKIYEAKYNAVYDKRNNLIAYTFVFHDITESEKKIDREHKIATTDSLTNALNRNGFMEEAEKFLSEHKSDTCYAIMVGGASDFKGINALYGTKAGDTLLIEVAERLREMSTDTPMVFGRTAEGKFAVVVSFDNVERIANIMNTVDIVINYELITTAHLGFGFVVMNDLSKSVEFYYERALLALAKAKKNANIYIVEYTKEMEESASRRQRMIFEMHNAIEKKQFFIQMQPQIDLKTGKVCGAECLVRWKHPTLGIVPPGEFIPLFEDNGFVSKIDRFVWEEAARTAVNLKKEGVYDGPVSVNVSQIDIVSMDVVKEFEDIVNMIGIERNRLHIEITESACADRRDKLIDTMQSLRDSGFIVEIDDFGSGYSSLNALMKLPFDTIKLDMEFMKEDTLSERSQIIVNSVVNMIHSMGSQIIVEGVETENNVNLSKNLTCDVVQGYFYSKPLAVDDFKEYVSKMN